LTNGGIICDIKVSGDEIIITCKNNINRLFSFRMNEALIFQKINDEEKIILSLMDYVKE